jgi:hypothetical protein
MFRRINLEPAESIDMLRSKNLAKFADIFTSDGERIGVTLRFVHRPIEDVNEEQKLYRSYLIGQSLELGGPFYVPTVYIKSYEPADNRVALAADKRTVNEETWNREPDFVARGLGVYEELPD